MQQESGEGKRIENTEADGTMLWKFQQTNVIDLDKGGSCEKKKKKSQCERMDTKRGKHKKLHQPFE
jgi:hypothetical protein